jgi:F-type H+-transporting ATPase subunit b
MQEIVHQLGELFLQAVPTVLIVLVFFLILRSVFFKPLLKVMAERDARTIGARKAAEAARAAAAEKARQYQDALKEARAHIYAEQETARKKLLDERAARLKEARASTAAQVTEAKKRIADELRAAIREVESTAFQLSEEIVRRILRVPLRPNRPVREAR